MVEDGTLDAFAPKTCYINGKVTEADLREYNGWAKVGCILLTMRDDNDAINAALDKIVKRLFFGGDRGFLPVEVIDEDGDAPTGLRHDVLQRAKTKARLEGEKSGGMKGVVPGDSPREPKARSSGFCAIL